MAESFLESGIIAYQQGDPQKAIGVFSKILKQDPNSADAWFWLGRCQQDAEKAKFCFERSAYLNQQLTSREYIYIDPDDIPKSVKSEANEAAAESPTQKETQVTYLPETHHVLSTQTIREKEFNPFLAQPLPEGFVYPRSNRSKLEIGLFFLLGALTVVLILALVIRFM